MTITTSSGQLTIYDRVADLPPTWDTVAQAGGLSLNRRFLQALQQNAVETGTRRYLLYQSFTGSVVIAVGELLNQPTTRNPVTSVLLGRLNRRLPAARNWLLPMLILHADLTSDVPILATASGAHERTSLLTEMLTALDKLAVQRSCSLAVTGIPADDSALTAVLSRQGYLKTVGRPFAELQLGYDSWQAFLKFAASRSKTAAANIRYEINRARREGISIVEWDPAAVPEAELYRLLDEHHRRLNNHDFDYQPGFLSALTRALGDNIRILLAVHEHQVQGVVAFAWTGTRGYVVFPGMIAKAQRTGFAYFNLTYYQPIQLAIELGLESLAYGNAAFAAKIRRGCTATETSLFFRPWRGVIRATLKAPVSLHQRLLQNKYASILQATAFSSLR